MRKRYFLFIAIIVTVALIFFTILFIGKQNNKDITPSGQPTQMSITTSMISQHNSAEDCWTYIGGQVFNATKIIFNNPEYRDILVPACGGNGADVYTVQKYSEQKLDDTTINKLRQQLSGYYIGYLAP